MDQEHFTWATDLRLVSPRSVSTGSGYLVMKPDRDPHAIGSPKQIVNGQLPGFLLSATAMVEVTDGSTSKWLALERDAQAPTYALHWQFPAGRIEPGETPVECALRELAEEVRITEKGQPVSADRLILAPQGDQFFWKTEGRADRVVRTNWVYLENDKTLECYFHLRLQVANFSDIEVADNEPYGRRVKLMTANEWQSLIDTDQVCPSSKMQWEKHTAKRLLERLVDKENKESALAAKPRELIENFKNADSPGSCPA